MLVCRLTGKEALSSPTFLPSSSSSWGGLELLRGPWCQDSAPHLRERGWLSRISQQDGSWQPPQASQPWTALRPSQESLPPPQAPECQNSVDFDSTCYPKVSTAQEGGGSSPLPSLALSLTCKMKTIISTPHTSKGLCTGLFEITENFKTMEFPP